MCHLMNEINSVDNAINCCFLSFLITFNCDFCWQFQYFAYIIMFQRDFGCQVTFLIWILFLRFSIVNTIWSTHVHFYIHMYIHIWMYLCRFVSVKYFTLLWYNDNVSNFLTATSTTVCDCLQNKQQLQQKIQK